MAVTFTGSSYLSTTSVPASQTLKGSAYTFSIWVYCTSAGGSLVDPSDAGVYIGVVGSGTSGSQFTDCVNIGNSIATPSMFCDMEQSNFAQELFVQGNTTTTNVWRHYAATYTGGNTTGSVVIYENGAVVTPSSSSGSLTSAVNWNRLVIGGFNGDAQDAWIFNRVLSASEIQLLYAGRGGRVSTSNLVGYWPLMGGGNSTADWSGNGRSLTATGTVVDASRQAPVTWGTVSPVYALRTPSNAIVATGNTQTTGAAAVTAQLLATGTTQTTGAVTVSPIAPAVGTTNTTGAITASPRAPAIGTTQTTGASTQAAILSVVGTTQTTGSADAPQALDTQLSSTPNIVGGWAYVSASATGQKLFWMGSAAADFMQIAVDGTTLTYELLNTSNGNHYLYTTTISLNTWFHVAFQKAISTCTSYFNGAVVDSASFTFTGLLLAGTLQFHKNLSGMMRHAFKSNNGVFDINVTNAMQSVGTIMAGSTPFTLDLWPILPGGGRLNGMGFGVGFDLKVLGVVPEVDSNPPTNWGGQNALFFKSAVTSMTASGTTQTSGSAAVTAQLLAAGTTNTTGSAAIAAVLGAVGTTQTTGAAVVANVLKASGTTQTTGAVVLVPQLSVVGTTQTTGSAAVIAQLLAVGTTQSTGAVAMTANGSTTIVPVGTTQTTGAAVIGYTQPMAASGNVQTSGAVVMGIWFAITATGTTQATGAAVATQGSPGGLSLAQKNAFASRRSAVMGGMRRRLR